MKRNEPMPQRMLERTPRGQLETELTDMLRSAPTYSDDPGAEARIWRGIVNQLQVPRRRSWFAPFALLVSGAAAGLLLAPVAPDWTRWLPQTDATLVMASGRVYVRDVDTSEETPAIPGTLPRNSVVRTERAARSFVRLKGETGILLEQNSAFRITSDKARDEVALESGEIYASVAKRTDRPFAVRVDAYRIEVLGTHFAVRKRAERLEIDVASGHVAVHGPSGTSRIDAGQCWSSTSDVVRHCDPAHDAALMETLTRASKETSTVLTIPGPSELLTELDGHTLGLAPIRTLVSPGRHQLIGRGANRTVRREITAERGKSLLVRLGHDALADTDDALSGSTEQETEVSNMTARERRAARKNRRRPASESRRHRGRDRARELLDDASSTAEPTSPSNTQPPPAPPESAQLVDEPQPLPVARPLDHARGNSAVATPPPILSPSQLSGLAKDLYDNATAFVSRRRYEQALMVLEELAELGRPYQALAFYEMARIQHRNLGDARGAVRSLLACRNRVGRSAFSESVAFTLIDVYLGMSELALAEQEITTFLATYPRSPRRNWVALLHGHVLRRQGACDRALGIYRHLASVESDAKIGDDASFYTARCTEQQGHRQQAAALYRKYLATYPRGAHKEDAERRSGIGR